MIDQIGSGSLNFRSIPLHLEITLHAYRRLKFFQGFSQPIYHRRPVAPFLVEASPVAVTANAPVSKLHERRENKGL